MRLITGTFFGGRGEKETFATSPFLPGFVRTSISFLFRFSLIFHVVRPSVCFVLSVRENEWRFFLNTCSIWELLIICYQLFSRSILLVFLSLSFVSPSPSLSSLTSSAFPLPFFFVKKYPELWKDFYKYLNEGEPRENAFLFPPFPLYSLEPRMEANCVFTYYLFFLVSPFFDFFLTGEEKREEVLEIEILLSKLFFSIQMVWLSSSFFWYIWILLLQLVVVLDSVLYQNLPGLGFLPMLFVFCLFSSYSSPFSYFASKWSLDVILGKAFFLSFRLLTEI